MAAAVAAKSLPPPLDLRASAATSSAGGDVARPSGLRGSVLLLNGLARGFAFGLGRTKPAVLELELRFLLADFDLCLPLACFRSFVFAALRSRSFFSFSFCFSRSLSHRRLGESLFLIGDLLLLRLERDLFREGDRLRAGDCLRTRGASFVRRLETDRLRSRDLERTS